MKAFCKHRWVIALFICFVAGVVACFGTTGVWFWFALISSMGTGIAALYSWLHPATPRPFEHVYKHEDWQFDPFDMKHPTLTILARDHGMGKKPRLEFRQGDWIFPCKHDKEGNITITRNNHSIGRFDDLGVIIRSELY